MSKWKLLILGFVAAAVVTTAIIQDRYARRQVSLEAPTRLLQGLDAGRIERIVITAGKESLTLQRREGGFVVASAADYPADAKKVNGLLHNCLGVRIRDVATANAERHGDLGVMKDKASLTVEFQDKDGKVITGIVQGKSDGAIRYVRLPDKNEVYRAEGGLQATARAEDYVERTFLDVPAGDVESIAFAGPGREFRVRFSSQDARPVVEPMPAGKRIKEEGSPLAADRLKGVSLSGLLAASDAEARNAKFDRKATCRTKSGLQYVLDLAPAGDDVLVRCRAEALQDDAADRARQFNATHANWVFKLSKWTADNLCPALSDVLEDVPTTLPAAKPAGEPKSGVDLKNLLRNIGQPGRTPPGAATAPAQ